MGSIKQVIVGGTTTREAVDVLQNWIKTSKEKRELYRENITGYRNWIGKLRNVNNPSGYSFTKELKNLENADWIAIVGSDVRKEAPLLNVRILKTKKRKNAKVIWFGSPSNMNYPLENGGLSPQKWQDFLEGRHPACQSFLKAKQPWVLVGTAVLERADTSSENPIIELQKQNPNVNWGIVHSKPNDVGLLDQGLNHSYPTKNSNLEQIQARMWILPDHYGNTIPLDSCEKFEEVMHTTHLPHYPIEKGRIFLPAKAWCEKKGSWMNMEGRMQYLEPSVNPYFEAKDEVEILQLLLKTKGGRVVYGQEANVNKEFLKGVEFGKGGLKGSYEKNVWNNYPIRTWMQGFYQTDLITSRSKTLSKCMRVLNQPKVDHFYRTGGISFFI